MRRRKCSYRTSLKPSTNGIRSAFARHLEPKNGERGRDDCCPEHDAKLGERLIPARREPDQQLSKKFDFLHHLRDRFAQGIDLTKGEAVGIDLGYVASLGLSLATVPSGHPVGWRAQA